MRSGCRRIAERCLADALLVVINPRTNCVRAKRLATVEAGASPTRRDLRAMPAGMGVGVPEIRRHRFDASPVLILQSHRGSRLPKHSSGAASVESTGAVRFRLVASGRAISSFPKSRRAHARPGCARSARRLCLPGLALRAAAVGNDVEHAEYRSHVHSTPEKCLWTATLD